LPKTRMSTSIRGQQHQRFTGSSSFRTTPSSQKHKPYTPPPT